MTLQETLKRKITPFALSIGLASGIIGCKETRTELSDVLHEDAVVLETVYTPSQHGSNISPTYTFGESGGNVGFAMTSVHLPEKYAVVFKCRDHGVKFIVQGTSKEYRSLWDKLEEGQIVDVFYRHVYESVYDDVENDGKKDLISKKLVKYDFLDANPKNMD